MLSTDLASALSEGYDQQVHKLLKKGGTMTLDAISKHVGAHDVYAQGDVVIALTRLIRRGKVVEKGNAYMAEAKKRQFQKMAGGPPNDYKGDLDAMEPPEDEVDVPEPEPRDDEEDDEDDEPDDKPDDDDDEDDDEDDEDEHKPKPKFKPRAKKESLASSLGLAIEP
jgi:hypothetical protein